ncbi:Flagellar basal-body rod protein FlgB [hydrothermal vent metagenome]|uniref:Flagellar basal-body rod protein FlgB n=1 Tax=hydrothermal vent metagenome TaxID=652676 RepID=A0A3B0T751_9ZZZZ
MDLKSISLFSSLNQKMDWLTERQKVLAQNIANANTPGYVPRDLKKVSFKAHLDQSNATGGLHLQTTDARHMSAAGPSGGNFEIKAQDTEFAISAPDGNAVALEDELIKMSETQMEYAMAVNLYRKHVSMLKTALGKRS